MSGVTKTRHTYTFDDDKLNKFGFADVKHIIYNELEGSLHSGKLCQSLLQKVQGLNVNVLTGTEITHYEEDNNGVRIYTNKGFDVKASKLLVCTNGFAKQLLPKTGYCTCTWSNNRNISCSFIEIQRNISL